MLRNSRLRNEVLTNNKVLIRLVKKLIGGGRGLHKKKGLN